MEHSTYIIFLIITLDSISYGMVLSLMSPYIQQLGGSQIPVGILTSCGLIFTLLSEEIVKRILRIRGKKFGLFLIYDLAMISYTLILLTDNYWITIIGRLIFCATNQSLPILRKVLFNTIRRNEDPEFFNILFSICSSSGYIFGPLIGGYLFSFKEGFRIICSLAIILTLTNNTLMVLLPKMDRCSPQKIDKTLFQIAKGNVEDTITDFRNCNFSENWDLICLRFLYSCSVIIFFSKFVQVLRHNYHASSPIIGCIAAYQNILSFIWTHLIHGRRSFIVNFESNFNKMIHFALITLCIGIMTCMRNQTLYIVLCIPLIASRSYVNSAWQNVFQSRNNEVLQRLNTKILTVCGIFMPLIFGMIHFMIGFSAVVIFATLPVFSCILIVKYQNKVEESRNKNM